MNRGLRRTGNLALAAAFALVAAHAASCGLAGAGGAGGSGGPGPGASSSSTGGHGGVASGGGGASTSASAAGGNATGGSTSSGGGGGARGTGGSGGGGGCTPSEGAGCCEGGARCDDPDVCCFDTKGSGLVCAAMCKGQFHPIVCETSTDCPGEMPACCGHWQHGPPPKFDGIACKAACVGPVDPASDDGDYQLCDVSQSDCVPPLVCTADPHLGGGSHGYCKPP